VPVPGRLLRLIGIAPWLSARLPFAQETRIVRCSGELDDDTIEIVYIERYGWIIWAHVEKEL